MREYEYEYEGDERTKTKNRAKIVVGFLTLLILSGLYVVRPFFHTPLMFIYRNPWMQRSMKKETPCLFC